MRRPVYDKANSFIEIRHVTADEQAVFERVRALASTLADPARDDYRTGIIRRACQDLLSDQPTSAAPSFTLRDHVIEEIRRLSDDELPRYLFYRYRYDVFPQTKQVDDFPPCLQIELTSICNYRCVFCYQTDGELTNPKNGFMGMMTLDLFKRVIDQAEGACEAVTLASRGEPLMCRDFDKMLVYSAGKFLALKVNTNAWFLDERKAHAILQAGVNTLVISADAAAEPLYSRLRVNGRLDRVLANVALFQRIRERDYPASRLITRVSGVRFTAEQVLDDMDGVWGKLVDQVAFVDYNPWENTYERPFSGVVTPCSDLWRRAFVWFDGTVNPCDVDYRSTLKVGDAGARRLTEVWTGPAYTSMRVAHLASQRSGLSPCNRCTFV